MGKIFTPINQIRLTNVATVKQKKGGKRFEIACYKNKVLSWRSGIERDLDEVLQSHQIFINVSKGQLAKKDDIVKCYKSNDEEKILKEILKNGTLQVSDKERHTQEENAFKEIAMIVASKCIDPETKRPHTASMIEKAMKTLQFGPSLSQSTKKQALHVIKRLMDSDIISIDRVSMKIDVQMPVKEGKQIKNQVTILMQLVNDVKVDDQQMSISGIVSPGNFKKINDLVQQTTRGHGIVHIISLEHTNES
ncbi:hypothetical protein SNEBB_001421 [Seison nebaliae]|nr:hypothetical protein SNEBB_001421 [Seison nebaliae]